MGRSGVNGAERRAAKKCVCVCVCVCVSIKSGTNCESRLFQPVFNRREICRELTDTLFFVLESRAVIFFFFSLREAKGESFFFSFPFFFFFYRSWHRSFFAARGTERCRRRFVPHGYKPLFLLSRFSPPPLPPAARPPRRYVDTYGSTDGFNPAVVLSSTRAFLAAHVRDSLVAGHR